MDMWMHMDTVIDHFGCSADRHANAQWLLNFVVNMDTFNFNVIVIVSFVKFK